jgi:hypothetical protein
VGNIKLEVGKLSKHWERAVCERSPPLFPKGTSPLEDHKPAPSAGTFPPPQADPKPSSASGHPSASDKVDGPRGHNFDNYHLEGGFGSVTTVAHPLVRGAFRLPTPATNAADSSPHKSALTGMFPHDSGIRSNNHSAASMGRLPKLNFPTFDGSDPTCGLIDA